jgi:predicted DsbA family dithiol-disulfide isomerase
LADLLQSPPGIVWHWYDLLCPYSYVAQDRNALLIARGYCVVELPLEAHPEIPPEGRPVPDRAAGDRRWLEQQAAEAALPLSWPAHEPNGRRALAAAEWVRRHAPRVFAGFCADLFALHFASGGNLGDPMAIERVARDRGIDLAALRAAFADGSAARNVARSNHLARRSGVRHTPAWLIHGSLIDGLPSRAEFDRLAPPRFGSPADQTRLDAMLDEALMESFPASDPEAIS